MQCCCTSQTSSVVFGVFLFLVCPLAVNVTYLMGKYIRKKKKLSWNSVHIKTEVDITQGAPSISSGFRICGKTGHLETGRDLSDLRTFSPTGEESIAPFVRRHTPCGCLPRTIRVLSESVLSESERGTRRPASCLQYFTLQTPWKTTYLIIDDYLVAFCDKLVSG